MIFCPLELALEPSSNGKTPQVTNQSSSKCTPVLTAEPFVIAEIALTTEQQGSTLVPTPCTKSPSGW